MIKVDCKEIPDLKVALALYLSESTGGEVLPLVKIDAIVFDEIVKGALNLGTITGLVGDFVQERAPDCSLEAKGDAVIVHSNVPRTKPAREESLPPGLLQCTFCAFVTPYEEEYTVHERAHLWGA